MNHWIIGKQVAIGIEFKVVAGFVEQHQLGVFQMLPHRQLSRMRIFANQRFKNLVMIVAPVIDGTRIDMVMQFFPLRVMYALGPHFFANRGECGIFCG